MASVDAAHEWTDAEIKRLAERLRYHYRKSARELKANAEERLEAYHKANKKMRERLKAGEISKAEYKRWCSTQAAIHSRDAALINGLTASAMKATAEARAMIAGKMPDIFAENANYAAFSIDKAIGYSTSFTLMNRDAVLELMRTNPKLLPIDAMKYGNVTRWHSQKFTSAITQGIIQGDPVGDIARRIMHVSDMDYTAAERAARTAATCAENRGRLHSYRRAISLGIEGKKRWSAVHDGRTRDSHRMVDGETVEVEEKFSNGLMEPGDADGEPEEVYNCRCRMKFVEPTYREADVDTLVKIPRDVDYEDWKRGVYHTDRRGRETKASKKSRGA